ncbi:SNF2-related protein [Longimicrobium sp.]|uniref:SNF2-related protein n=1 Tax=Longimicrobium sp. TaxID=2029185 RepID=UPI003B3B8601
MIAVHACWSPFGLHLWGESSQRLAALEPSRGRRPRPPRPHPFAATAAALREALGEQRPAAGAGAGEITLHLPSGARVPLASPHLGHVAPDEGGAGRATAAWTVEVLSMQAADALDLLLALPADAPGVVLGQSVRWFAEVATLALELVAGGRVLPLLEPAHGGRWVARWRPLLAAEADGERVAALRRAMPGACAAHAPPTAMDDAAGRALDALTDACVRRGGEQIPIPAPRRSEPREPAQAWRDALFAAEATPRAGGAGWERMHAALAAWSRTLAPAAASGIRTCFQLTPPVDPVADADAAAEQLERGAKVDAWRLDFLLQPVDDPSLLVPAGEVWRARGALQVFRRTLEQPQERLLEDLGRALRLVPGLQPALRGACPTGMSLDAEGAYRFLREDAPLLAQAGFGVRVPPWWNGPAARLGLKLKARSTSAPAGAAEGRFGLETLLAYDWRVSIGGQPLTADEFLALAQAKVPLVRFRGQWVELRPEEMTAALRLFEQGASGEMSAAELLRLAAGADGAGTALPVDEVEAEGWLGELLASAADARVQPVAVPESFTGTLRPYQARGLSWLAFMEGVGLGACLADDMGLGKTVQLLALLLARPLRPAKGKKTLPTLLVCPMSLVGNWQREAARFAPGLRVHVHHGGERLGGAALRRAVRGSDLVITTYALAARDRDELGAVDWGRVVLDEAQNVKNSAARQAQAVRSFRAPRRIALTGTPVENRLSEMWSILDFLNPGLLGSARDFRAKFALPIERYRDADRAAQLKRLAGPFILRRLKTDRGIIQDLPDKQEMKVFCNLTREQASLYQAVVDDMLRRIEGSDGIQQRGLVLSMLLRLKQACNHPAQLLGDGSALAGRSGKLERLEELLDEVMQVGDRALVFTQFAEMGHLLQARLQERFAREIPFLHGGTRKADRDALVARFQGADGPPVLLLSLKAGGTGLNLTAANHVIHFDRWWNPAVEDQATDRAFRIGQRRDVQVRKLVCAGTLEERIDQVIEEKKALAGSVLGTGEAWLTEMSTDELRRVVALSADAVAE